MPSGEPTKMTETSLVMPASARLGFSFLLTGALGLILVVLLAWSTKIYPGLPAYIMELNKYLLGGSHCLLAVGVFMVTRASASPQVERSAWLRIITRGAALAAASCVACWAFVPESIGLLTPPGYRCVVRISLFMVAGEYVSLLGYLSSAFPGQESIRRWWKWLLLLACLLYILVEARFRLGHRMGPALHSRMGTFLIEACLTLLHFLLYAGLAKVFWQCRKFAPAR